MAGYSGTPLAKKLGFKDDYVIKVVGAPDHYWDLFNDLPDIQVKPNAKSNVDVIHVFSTELAALTKELLKLKKQMKEDGTIWVSWPKKASKVPTDITEDKIRDFVLKNGLVDIKVCAVDDVWSGLKLVIPVKERKGAK